MEDEGAVKAADGAAKAAAMDAITTFLTILLFLRLITERGIEVVEMDVNELDVDV